ncbi:MAG TPA: nuclear transport factor 2 family protein [Gemmataceae bacterium]|nr:nuclear transport factor 2 family protein [Gemmataceae bacterium]
MPDESSRAEVAAAIERINRAWLDRRPADLGPLFHPALTMVLPGFGGRVEGREANVAGFTDFCTHATIHEYRERDRQIDVFGDTAVASFAYEMVYERSGQRSRATGRDLWVFARQQGSWLAVWRTMLDLAEQPAEPAAAADRGP